MLTYMLMKTSRQMKSGLDKALSELGYTSGQFALMNQIELMKNEAASYEIADRLSSDRPTVSGIVQRLTQKGILIKKDHPEDRRSQIISLSLEGLKDLQALRTIADQVSADIFKAFSELEKANLKTYLEKISESLEG